MFQARFHGRGGQGVVTAAQMLSVAAFLDGLHAQAFPSFGSERMGAPVVSYCRIDEKPIRTHEPVSCPDAVIVSDPTLVHQVDLFAGLEPDGYLLVNTSRLFDELGITELTERLRSDRVASVPATQIAQVHIGRPFPNTALLGATAELTAAVSLSAVIGAIERRFAGASAGSNIAAAREAARALVAGRQESISRA